MNVPMQCKCPQPTDIHLNKLLYKPSAHTKGFPSRRNILSLRRSNRIKLLNTIHRGGINRKRHSRLTMFRLSTIKPQRRLSVNLKFDAPESDETGIVFSDIGGLKTGENAPWFGFAGSCKVGLDESVVCGEEV